MDNITHGALGIAAAILAAPRHLRGPAALAGLIAAELPDFDIFLANLAVLANSGSDPLLPLEMHRHFTHSLVMIPVLGLLGLVMANGLRLLFRRRALWRGLFFPAIAAVATHGLCDTWTSYGTHLLWPFTERRESWDLISVIDPLLTLPLLAGAILAWKRSTRRPAVLGLCWVVFYLGLCGIQQYRAREAVTAWAAAQGHPVTRLTVKPSFGNIMVWRGLYERDGLCQVVCVRSGITEGTRVIGTATAGLLNPDRPAPPLDRFPQDSVQMRDVRRFRHFSDNWLGLAPGRPDVIGDLRYATLPDRVDPLWGIVIFPDQPERHVQYAMFREAKNAPWGQIWRMVIGEVKDP